METPPEDELKDARYYQTARCVNHLNMRAVWWTGHVVMPNGVTASAGWCEKCHSNGSVRPTYGEHAQGYCGEWIPEMLLHPSCSNGDGVFGE